MRAKVLAGLTWSATGEYDTLTTPGHVAYSSVMDTSNPMARAIEAGGGLTKLAASLGVMKQVVHNWRLRGKPPVAYVLRIEELTGVSRRELCEDWPAIWPEVEPAAAPVQQAG
jgi:DNA-binding transcriptional regulator YdaS (Cro superfamily)